MTDSLTKRAYEIVMDDMHKNEDYVLMKIKERWPKEYAAGLKAQMEFDSSFEEKNIPSLGFVCEQVKKKDEERFLKSLTKIWD